MPQQHNPNLTNFEQQVLFNKATEPAFSGQYDSHFDDGVYVCKNCNSLLYYSRDKFNSGCGWPAFDDEAMDAVTKIPDEDGRRVEIICNHCQSHLGHVFTGEKLTDKNVRHCVNSASLRFIAAKNLENIVVAAGCFWGVEYFFKKLDGVVSAISGYSGGELKNPTYQQICDGQTGHFEVVQILFETQKVSTEKVLKYFFEIHDFTQTDGQGGDIGQQYESAIFYQNHDQKNVADDLIQELTKMGYKPATKILPAKPFYSAELYHQNYYQKTGKTPYCHVHKTIF